MVSVRYCNRHLLIDCLVEREVKVPGVGIFCIFPYKNKIHLRLIVLPILNVDYRTAFPIYSMKRKTWVFGIQQFGLPACSISVINK